ncbi:MAG: tol-pal system-associated acyl-CoA thioesterase [Alphaproteobacteria bacterium]|jgi:acyl-CoA thioester hydrolase
MNKPSFGPHIFNLRVYYEDTDAGGVVYYANYLKFAERGRTEYLRDAGVSHRALAAKEGTQFVVRRVEVDFKASAHLDDDLAVWTEVTLSGGAQFVMDQVVKRGSDELAHLVVQMACVNAAGRATRIPADVAKQFSELKVQR